MLNQATAAVARIPGGEFTIETVSVDDPRAHEILIDIAGVGLCHTDLVFSAKLQIMKPPAVLGHEGSGIVAKVGSAVTKVKPGDHVVLTFNSCGDCPRCNGGEPAYCFSFPKLNYAGGRLDGSPTITIGDERASANFFGQSSFATRALAHERNVIKVDRDVPIELLGPLGCGVQTGAGAIMRSLACRKGSSLLVLGGGAVGLSAVLGAVVRECATIIVVEPKQARRELALQLGATHVIDPSGIDLPAAVRAITPTGVDYAFDSSGLKQVIAAAIGCLASHAKFGLVGVPPSMEDAISIPITALVGGGFSFIGIMEGDSEPEEFIPQMVALYKAGRFPFDKLLSTYALHDINLAIADSLSGKCVKPVMLTA
ncbi:MAG: geraniol dehydrogenase [Hydrocarboniphaga sp.]|uniref:NAD(P)-dependent alcohol dehydrogenase n=1 Tax=Hydrocarboniphaga sp. TaxID=2033016 RepID=UPI002610B3B7|nr:NAD(P)-dependent alcohol dehydrogenase [Hydrocarboniphaga sp.]MDB5969970.1 geraniol dehydrogenase [Hydrocarboniphaga sp.]